MNKNKQTNIKWRNCLNLNFYYLKKLKKKQSFCFWDLYFVTRVDSRDKIPKAQKILQQTSLRSLRIL